MERIKHFTSSVFVFNKVNNDIKILLVHHKKFNKWMIPGGHVEEYENPSEAAIREVLEETSLNIKLISFHNNNIISIETKLNDGIEILCPEYIFEELIPASHDKPEHIHIDCLFCALTTDTNIKHNETESNSIKWINVNEINQLDMFDVTKVVINRLIKKII